MLKAVEAIVEQDGTVRLAEPVDLGACRHALVILLGEVSGASIAGEAALLSEPALAEDWNRPEEEAAWAHLQPEP